jgi:hypothetical protein
MLLKSSATLPWEKKEAEEEEEEEELLVIYLSCAEGKVETAGASNYVGALEMRRDCDRQIEDVLRGVRTARQA